METYKDSRNEVKKAFAVGVKTNLNEQPIIFYIDKDTMDYNKVIIDLIEEMLIPKYNSISTFYCHNFGKYDAIFIINCLNRFNQEKGNTYRMDFIFKDSTVNKLTITKKVDENKSSKVVISDSYLLLPFSLDKLCKSFNTDYKKTFFPTQIR